LQSGLLKLKVTAHRSVLVLGMATFTGDALASTPMVDLGSATGFAVLSGAGISNTGTTTITGDVGSTPTVAITGFGSVTLDGTNHGGDAVTQVAKIDLAAAYNSAVGRTADVFYGDVYDLGGLTLTPGVYNGSSSLFLTGDLILDAQGDPNAVWVFQAASTLITASNSTVTVIGGADASRVFWQVGSSATLGTGSDFSGVILAMTSITLETGATVDGQALAIDGAVTMDTNIISGSLLPVPEPSGAALVMLGILGCLFYPRHRQAIRV
jgi:Ice-binding-like